MPLLTRDEVRAEFTRKGISISAWALDNHFAPNIVYDVLAGRNKGARGQSHAIAVTLGMKVGEICPNPSTAMHKTAV